MDAPNKNALNGKLYEAAATYYGIGTVADKALGKSKLEILANLGDLEANLRLAIIELGEKNINGVKMLQELAIKQYMPAIYDLGNVYYFGFGDLSDKEIGLSYWQKAAALGHIYARLNTLKIQSQSATFRARATNVFKIWANAVKLAIVTIRNPNGERVLGTTPRY
jgi:TPR repeat protein